MSVKHFLTLQDLSSDELNHIIQRAGELKKNPELACPSRVRLWD